MNRTLKVLIGAAAILLVSMSTATAQTGTLQGRALFLYDGGFGPNLNRVGLITRSDTGLTSNIMFILPRNTGNAGDILYTPDGTGTIEFTSGNNQFWKLLGNSGTTAWNGVTGNFVGTTDNQKLVLNASDNNSIEFWNGLPNTRKMELNSFGNLGLGAPANAQYRSTVMDITGAYDGGLFQTSRPGGTGLVVAAGGGATMGINVNASDVGIGIGQNILPVNGMEIDATAVGILFNKYGNAPAVGVSMDGSATGVIIENSTYAIDIDGTGTALLVRNAGTSIDANGAVWINNNHLASPVNINTGTATGSTTIGSATAGPISLRSTGDIMLQVDGGGSGDDLVVTGVDNNESTTKILTLDGANNVRYRNVAASGSIITGSGTVNQIPKWTPGTTTLGNSNISDNGSLVTVASAMTQTGTTNINATGTALTTLGNSAVGNTVRVASGDVEMTALPAGATTDELVTINGTNDVRRISSATFLNANAWKLGGNTLTGNTIFGSLSAHDVIMQTGGSTRLTLSAAGAITQSGTGQVTWSGNVDATLGLDVTGGSFTALGTAQINNSGAATSTIGNTATGGAVDIRSAGFITLDPSATGDVRLPNTDVDTTVTRILGLDASNNVRTRAITGGSVATGSGTVNTIVKWTPTGSTLGNSNITDNGSLVTVSSAMTQTGTTLINTTGAAATSIGSVATGGAVNVASAGDVSVTVAGGASDLVLNGIPTDGGSTKVLTLDGSNNVRFRTVSTGTNIITGAGTLNTIPMWTPDGVTLGNSTISQNAAGTLVTIANALTQTGATNINTTGTALTTLGNSTVGNIVRVGSGDVEMPSLAAGAGTDDFVTITGVGGDVRRTSSATIINSTAWKLGGNTLSGATIFGSLNANDVVMQTAGTTRLTLGSTGAITQSGTGQVTFSGNVDATLGLDVTGGTFSALGTALINNTGSSNTTIGHNASAGTVSIGSNASVTVDPGAAGNVILPNIDPDASATRALVLDASNNLRTVALPGTGSIITGSGTTNQIPKWTPSGTQLGNSNISDNGSLVTVASAMTQTGATLINTTGAATTGIGNATTGGAVSIAANANITLNPGAGAGNVVMSNIDPDATTTSVLTLDGSGNVRTRTVAGTGTILTGTGTTGRHAIWTSANTLSDASISEAAGVMTFLTNDVRVATTTPAYTAGSAPGTRRLMVMETATGQIQYASFPGAYSNRSLRYDGTELVPSVFTDDGTNFNLTTAGSIILTSSSTNDVTINVTGAGGNDLVLTGIDADPTATNVLVLDGAGNVRTRSIGGAGSIVTGSGTTNFIPKWTPTGFVLGDSKISDNGTDVAVDGTANFNANGNVNLGDATADAVTIRGDLRVPIGPNQFAGRVMITGAPGTTVFTISNARVTPTSIIIVSLEDGTNTSNYTATVFNKLPGASFDVRLSSVMMPASTKWVNYQIINQ